MSANSEQVKAIQQALKDQGHDPGDIDGIMGPKTQAALRDYQQKQGLKVTGRLDAETSAKLGVEAKTSAAPSASGSSPAASPSTSAPASSDTKAKTDTGMKSDSSTKSDSATKPGSAGTSAKPSDNKQK
jgi:peptidoglycan hydrolase-like protein with peptidoglycan-binding domain